MPKIDLINECIENPYPYAFCSNSWDITDEATARDTGLSCHSFAWLSAILRGFYMPHGGLPYETYRDKVHIATIDSFEKMQRDDILWHGPAGVNVNNFKPMYNQDGYLTNWHGAEGSPAQHMSVFTGDFDNGDPVVVHASFRHGKTIASPLSEISAIPSLGAVTRIGRLITPSHAEIQFVNASRRTSG
jgi:hypothetical protein